MIKISLAIDGFEQKEAERGEIDAERVRYGSEVRAISAVEQLSSPEMLSDENLYGSHIGDRENYTRSGACGSRKSGSYTPDR